MAHAGGQCTQFDDPTDLSSCDAASEIFAVARELPRGLVDVIVAGHQPDLVPRASRPDVRKVEHPKRNPRRQSDALAQAADYCGAFRGGSV